MAEPTARKHPARRRRSHGRGRRAGRQRLGALLLAVLVALSLLALAVPRTVGLMLLQPAARPLAQLRQRLPVDPAAMDRVIDAEAAASAWIDSGALWQDLAAAHLHRSHASANDPQASTDALLRAESALRRSLARRPGNAIAWWQLASVTNLLGRPGDQVAAALHLSVVTGNRVETLLFPRVQLALAKWRHLDEATRQAFKPQLARAMQRDPKEFITLVRRSLAEEHVRSAFRGERELLETYGGLIDQSLPLPGARQS